MTGKHEKRVLLIAVVLSWSYPIWSQLAVQRAARDLTVSRTYFLGVMLGQASVHAMVPNYMAASHCLSTLKLARDVTRDLLAVLPEFQITRYERPIRICTSDGRNGGDMQRHWNTYRASLSNNIAVLRAHASSLLIRKKRSWHLSFKLGEALGIAEGQAAIGEQARAIVRDALVQANRFAVAQKLEMVAGTFIIRDIDAGQPMTSIYRRVVALRKSIHDRPR